MTIDARLMCTADEPDTPIPAFTSRWRLPHRYQYLRQGEYWSLADGGSYEVLQCKICGRVAYSPLPD